MIYTITMHPVNFYGRKRCVGYTENFKDADEIVKDNICDICEGETFRYEIIEEVEPGVYMCYPRKEFWYKWNHEKDGYEPCEKPERFKNTVAFGIG